MPEDEDTSVLDLEIRRKIFHHISRSPGLHERELARELHLPMSTLGYHLYCLKKSKLIMPKTDGRYTRYYIMGKLGVMDKKILGLLRQKTPRKIIMFLLLHPNATHREICEHLQLSPATTTFHLQKLIRAEIIESKQLGREKSYTILDSEYTSKVLITYRRSFVDSAVDTFIDTWFEINPDHIHTKKSQTKEKKKNPRFLFFLFGTS